MTRHSLPHRSAVRTAPLLLALALCGPITAQAASHAAMQAAPPAITPPAAAAISYPADPALLAAFGERAGVQRLAEALADKLMTDPRTKGFFKKTKAKHFKQQLSDQFCQVLAAGCVYDGETMKNSHAGFDITRSDFNTVVEMLQDCMDAQGIAFAAQNRLLARLAPMHRDIITR